VRPGNSWDLQSFRQLPGESLRDYIRRFSKQRTELPNITDSDVIDAFLAGTTCRDLVSVAELPELFQLKCLSPALEARPHLNGNNPSIPRI
jgi:hypothetical protein